MEKVVFWIVVLSCCLVLTAGEEMSKSLEITYIGRLVHEGQRMHEAFTSVPPRVVISSNKAGDQQLSDQSSELYSLLMVGHEASVLLDQHHKYTLIYWWVVNIPANSTKPVRDGQVVVRYAPPKPHNNVHHYEFQLRPQKSYLSGPFLSGVERYVKDYNGSFVQNYGLGEIVASKDYEEVNWY